jgi:O-antigen/teichoic acid export membrane protein
VAVIYLTRSLGPHGYGEVSWALAAFNFALFMTDLGLTTIGIRRLAQQPEALSETVNQVATLRAGLTVLMAILLVVFGLFTGPTATIRQLTAWYGVALLANGLVIDWVFIGLQRMQYIGLARVLQYTIYPLLLVLWVRGAANVMRVPLASTAAVLAAAVFLLLVFARSEPQVRLRPSLAAWGALLRVAAPLAVSSLLVQIYLNLPVLMLGWMQGEAATGYYAGAMRTLQVMQEGLAWFLLACYPVAAHRWQTAPQDVGRLLEWILKLALIGAVPIAVSALVVGRELFALILGPEYGTSVLPFQIMVWNLVLVALNGVYAQLGLLMNARQKEYLLVVGLGAGLSLILNLALIPLLSHVGVALAWVLAEAVVALVSFRLVRRQVRFATWRHLLRPLAAAGAMALGGWWLNWLGAPLPVVVGACAALYGLGLVAIGGVNRQDLDFARGLLRQRT